MPETAVPTILDMAADAGYAGDERPDDVIGALMLLAGAIKGAANPEDVAAAIEAWVEDHPEAVAAIADGAITTDKLADAAVTSEKLDDDVLAMFEDASSADIVAGWLRGNQLTGELSGTIATTSDAYAAPPMALAVDGVSTQVTTTGKNLFDKDNATILYGYLTVNASEGWAYLVSNSSNRTVVIPVAPNTTYTFSLTAVKVSTADDDIPIALYDSYPTFDSENKGQFIPWNQWTWTAGPHGVVTFTTGANAEYVACKYANISKVNPVATIATIQLEAGSTATAYEPYTGGKASPNPDYPQPILSVDELALEMHNTNLLDFEAFSDISNFDTSNLYAAFPIRVPKGATVTAHYDGTGISLNEQAMNLMTVAGSSAANFMIHNNASYANPTRSVVATDGVVYLNVYPKSQNGLDAIIEALANRDFRVNIATEALSYEPYQGQSIPLYDGTLRSLPDGTKDELHLAYLKPSTREGWAWYSREVTAHVGWLRFGDVSWSRYTNRTNPYFCTNLSNLKTVSSNAGVTNLRCTAYQRVSGTTLLNNVNIDQRCNLGSWEVGEKALSVVDKQYETADAFKTAMADAAIEYPYATPVTTQLDPIELPALPAPTAKVWCDGGSAQPTYQMEYVKDTNAVIQRLEDIISDLATS